MNVMFSLRTRMKSLMGVLIGATFLMQCRQESDPEQRLQELLKKRNELDAEIDALKKQLSRDDTLFIVVKGMVLQEKPFEVTTEFQGVVASDDMVDLRPEMSGRILRIHVKEGDMVQPGQKLATLDGEQVRKALEEAEKALELARTAYERQQALWEQKIGSEIQYLQAKNQKEQLELRIESLKNQLEKFVLTAPVQGTVDRIFMHAGDVASPAAPVLRIVNNRSVKIEADVSERYVGAFDRHAPVRLRFPATGLSMPGRFRSIGQSIDPNNRTFLVVIDPQGEDRTKLLPNMLARVEVVLRSEPRALTLPTAAIVFEKDAAYVWVSEAGKARKVPVKTGATRGGETEITDGLKAGDVVIIEGFRNLKENDRVKVLS